jgi:hypothetical protein
MRILIIYTLCQILFEGSNEEGDGHNIYFRMLEGYEKCIKDLVRKAGRPRCRWKDKIKIDCKEWDVRA